ncbi:MAG: MarR family transcriptional regulator [Betaproteobacteria bacterium]|nr:MarR family transcriptional regulator [Betaproteobacteria bacterium]
MSNKVKPPARSEIPEPRSRAPAAPEGTRVALGMLPGLLGYHVRLAQIAIFEDFERALEHLGVSPGLFALLVIIDANPGLKQTALAQAARIDRSTLVPALNKLEQRGLVERRSAPADRRSNGLFLTTAGAELLHDATGAVREHEAGIASGLTGAEREQLMDMLDRLAPRSR